MIFANVQFFSIQLNRHMFIKRGVWTQAHNPSLNFHPISVQGVYQQLTCKKGSSKIMSRLVILLSFLLNMNYHSSRIWLLEVRSNFLKVYCHFAFAIHWDFYLVSCNITTWEAMGKVRVKTYSRSQKVRAITIEWSF